MPAHCWWTVPTWSPTGYRLRRNGSTLIDLPNGHPSLTTNGPAPHIRGYLDAAGLVGDSYSVAGMQENTVGEFSSAVAYTSPPESETVYLISGVTDDGTTDVTAAINTWLAGLPDGTPDNRTVARFGQNKTYRINSSVNLTLRSHMGIDGNGSTFTRTITPANTTTNVRHFTFDRCSNLTVRNIKIVGDIPWPRTGATWSGSTQDDQRQYDHAFAFRGCTSVIHEDCDYQNIWGDGVYLGMGLSGTAATSGYTARRVHGRRAGRGGLQIVRASHVLFEDCDVDIQGTYGSGSGLFALNIEPNDGDTVSGVVYRRCRIGRSRLPGIQVVGDSATRTAATINGVTFDDCTAIGGAVLFADFRPAPSNTTHRYRNISITNSRPEPITQKDYLFGPPTGTLYPYIKARNIDGLTVTGNTQHGNSDHCLVHAQACTAVTVSSNTTTGMTTALVTVA